MTTRSANHHQPVSHAFTWKWLLPIFLISLTLEMAHFFPTLGQINIWDEANYLQMGYRLLTVGTLPDLAGSPLSAVFYALTMAPVQNSPHFFVLGDAIGRILMFVMVYVSACLIARALTPIANPWVMLGLVVIVPVATTMYLYPSDVLFSALAGLAFWQLLKFYWSRERRHAWWASAFMGLGALARAEGLLLMGVMALFVLLLILQKRDGFKSLLAVMLPFVWMVGGYLLIYGLVTGDFDAGLSDRTYNNFESGQEIIYSHTGIFTATISARLEAREAFGTPEENDNSVLKAIRRNPAVYGQRLRRVAPEMFAMAVKAYGNKFLLLFLWLSIRGWVFLFQKRHWPLALLCLAWFLPLVVGVLNTFFREGYFMMPYFVVFALSAIGLTAILENFDNPRERWGLLAGSLSVLLVGLLLRNTSMLYRNGLWIAGLGLVYLLWRQSGSHKAWGSSALWLLLALTLIIRGGYPSPVLPVYGQTPTEQAVAFLQENFPSQSNVLAGAPANVWAARMTYFGINSYDIPAFEDAEDFYNWLLLQDIGVVFMDQHVPSHYRQYVNTLAENQLIEVFSSPSGDILVYQVWASH